MASRSAKAGMKRGKMQVYNAQGSKAVESAEDEEGEFKHGGKAKHKRRRHGGHAEGHEPHHRADKKARGGHTDGKMKHGGHHRRAAGGKTPYSSGHHTTMPGEAGKTDSGHEGQRPSEGD